jgi:hypothetical protein
MLRLEQVPGLLALRLNGIPLTPGHGTEGRLEFPATVLNDRNRLELDVDLAAAAARSAIGIADWGIISLVIRSALGSG